MPHSSKNIYLRCILKISMSDKLIDHLKEYKLWCINQKRYLGDGLGNRFK